MRPVCAGHFFWYEDGMNTAKTLPPAGTDAVINAQAGVWCAFFSLILLMFASLGWFVFPIADDHGYFLEFGHLPYWEVAKHAYFTFTGRYFATLVLAFLSGYGDNLPLYHAYASLHIMLLLASLFFLISSCHRGNFFSTLAMTLCLGAAFVSGLPSPSQGLYWMCGSFTFFTAFVAVFLTLGALCRLAFFPESNPVPWIAVGMAGIFVSMGCNELTAAACMFFLALASGAAWLIGHERKKLIGLLALWGLLLLCFSFTAPGNFSRSGSFERGWEWGFLLNVAGGMFEGFKWITRTPVIPAILFCAVLFRPRWDAGAVRYSPAKRFAFWLVLACALFLGEYLLVYVSSKRAPYARMNNAIFHAAFTMALLGGAVMLGDIRKKLRGWCEKKSGNAVFACLGTLLAAFIVFQPSVSASIRNYANGEFAAYRQVWLTRLAMLPPRDKAGDIVLTLPALKSRPFPIVFRDLVESQDKHQWIPDVFTRYHGLKGIIVEPGSGGK